MELVAGSHFETLFVMLDALGFVSIKPNTFVSIPKN